MIFRKNLVILTAVFVASSIIPPGVVAVSCKDGFIENADGECSAAGLFDLDAKDFKMELMRTTGCGTPPGNGEAITKEYTDCLGSKIDVGREQFKEDFGGQVAISTDSLIESLDVFISVLELFVEFNPAISAAIELARIFGFFDTDDVPDWVEELSGKIDDLQKDVKDLQKQMDELGYSLKAFVCKVEIQNEFSPIGTAWDNLQGLLVVAGKEEMKRKRAEFETACSKLPTAIKNLADLLGFTDDSMLYCADNLAQGPEIKMFMNKKYYREVTFPIMNKLLLGLRVLDACPNVSSSAKGFAKDYVLTSDQKFKELTQKIETEWTNEIEPYQVNKIMEGFFENLGKSIGNFRNKLLTDGPFDYLYSFVHFEPNYRRNSSYGYYGGSDPYQEGLLTVYGEDDGNELAKRTILMFYRKKSLNSFGKSLSSWKNEKYPNCDSICEEEKNSCFFGCWKTCIRQNCHDARELLHAVSLRNLYLHNQLTKGAGVLFLRAKVWQEDCVQWTDCWARMAKVATLSPDDVSSLLLHCSEDSIPKNLADLPLDMSQLKQMYCLDQIDGDEASIESCQCEGWGWKLFPIVDKLSFVETSEYPLTIQTLPREGDYVYNLIYPTFQ